MKTCQPIGASSKLQLGIYKSSRTLLPLLVGLLFFEGAIDDPAKGGDKQYASHDEIRSRGVVKIPRITKNLGYRIQPEKLGPL